MTYFYVYFAGYPKGSKENNCAFRESDGTWVDVNCEDEMSFTCEILGKLFNLQSECECRLLI